jgi:acetyl esterase
VTTVDDEGVLDPWVAKWIEANPMPSVTSSPEMLELARGPMGMPPTREIASVTDDVVGDVPVRVYRGEEKPTGLVVYFHGGGWCIGSIGIMDNVARELAHATGAVVVSVGYRLAPEHPFPSGLDDCETVARWAVANAASFGVQGSQVVIAGESAGGNLAAAVALRLRDAGATQPAGQILIYPVVDSNSSEHPSRREFRGVVVSADDGDFFWKAYTGGRTDLDHDPYAAPLHAPDLTGLPPALVMVGGCDFLRDEGRAYAARLREAGVATEEVSYPGQPHGFLNFGFPVAVDACERIGTWTKALLAAAG